MTWIKKWYVWIPFLILIFVFVYFFSNILIYILLALIIALMGNPLVRFLDKLKLKKLKIPHFISALISLLVVVSVIVLSVIVVIPIIIEQARYLSSVDINAIFNSMEGQINELEVFLREYGLLGEDASIEALLTAQMNKFIESVSIHDLANSLLGMLGSLSIGIFSVLFLSYFFMRDDKLLLKGLTTFTPNESHDEIERILFYSKKMLSRYFIGIFAELICVATLISVGMYIIGLKNGIFIGVIASIFNVIPYIGPILGGIVGSLIGFTTISPDVFASESGQLLIKMIVVFVATNLIDNFVFQPVIYSRSVKAHPIEIFIVILMAGTIAGPIGMILAIPAYTILRIIAMEFFSNWDFVQNLTKGLNKELQKTKDGEGEKSI